MFGFFNKNNKCSIEEERRQWFDKSFLWLINNFGEDYIKGKKIITPQKSDFPFEFVGDEENAYEIVDVLAPQMDIEPDDIEIEFYTEAEIVLKTGNAANARVFLQQVENEKYSSGLYWGKREDGKFHIGLETKYLNHPEKMVATLAHELAHIKLLGEERIKKNNEPLTDLTTIVFGLGIFGANSAFQFINKSDSWGYSRSGYLTQMDWGYALALFAFLRKEKTPEWTEFLTLNVKSDFKQSERFIYENEEIILKPTPKQD